jgi:hypothetical protein
LKKEVLAGAMLLALFSAALINIASIDRLTADLAARVEAASAFAAHEDWAAAETEARAAADLWKSRDPHTHIVLRHTEIDGATAAFYDLLKEIYVRDQSAVRGTAEALSARLHTLSAIEKISLGSIF